MLASFWLGRARTKEGPEEASGAYAWAVLFHLFFVTLLPFSMIVVARYNLAPAICVYAVNMVLLAGTAYPSINLDAKEVITLNPVTCKQNPITCK